MIQPDDNSAAAPRPTTKIWYSWRFPGRFQARCMGAAGRPWYVGPMTCEHPVLSQGCTLTSLKAPPFHRFPEERGGACVVPAHNWCFTALPTSLVSVPRCWRYRRYSLFCSERVGRYPFLAKKCCFLWPILYLFLAVEDYGSLSTIFLDILGPSCKGP